MFSSGFFLLPGLASAQAGPSVVLAYLIGGIMVLPAMLSAAELSTAMPRAGGPYYFLDRSLGPMVGTVGGLGTWMALIFKSAFALVGMGAYLAIFYEIPIKPVAVAFTLFFTALNIFGVKKTSGLQGILVVTLVSILIFFVIAGLAEIFSLGFYDTVENQFKPFTPFGFEGLIGTVGLVFVSYAGLTQVASVSEEVQNPDRNIPLGMILSLITATVVYVVGVFIMVAVLNPDSLREDLTPVATAAGQFLDWMPFQAGIILIVIAAIAAFASTGNAGIMSAARYPFAMARDNLLWKDLSAIGRHSTPTIAILVTSSVMIFFILVLNVEDIAKLASAFMLLIFGLLNLAVIIMRESRIEEYDPGFKSPLYPWTQVAGILISIWLIAEMGVLSVLFTLGLIIACIAYFHYYASKKVKRSGAIFHVHARLGKMQYEELEWEMRGILREKGLRKEDPYERAVGRSIVIELQEAEQIEEITERVSERLADRVGLPTNTLVELFHDESSEGVLPVGNNTGLKHIRIDSGTDTEIVLVRVKEGIRIDNENVVNVADTEESDDDVLHALIYLVSSNKKSGQHLRILAHLAEMIDSVDFCSRWNDAKDEAELREILLRDERFINLTIYSKGNTSELIHKKVKDLVLPGESLITIIKRSGQIIFPHGNTVLREDDELSIIGEKDDIEELKKQYLKS
ncbi:amino acid transporter [Rhodohalobacter mucosus]|uniref:Amino acid transporter n=2 Tax=Rhodohalobacter mucosus TaxID=2079485 RepID=A0A316TV28_9BACT|nr:amino acid transporter [Rhodohalobacter mucosus]